MLFKIFSETNDGPSALEDKINNFFDERLEDGIEFVSMNTVVEKVDGIDYLTIVICYKYI